MQSIPTCRECGTAWGAPSQAGPGPRGRRARSKPKASTQHWTQDAWDSWHAQGQPATVPSARQVRFEEPPPPPGILRPSHRVPKPKVGPPPGLEGELLRKLHASATPEISALLREAGLAAPEPVAPSLSELCQQHILSLPAAIQEALAEPPVVTNPAQQVLQENRRFKEATGELRNLIATQVDLQGKITKAKHAYSSLLAEMQSHMATLEKKQAEVQDLQQKLREQMQVQEPVDPVATLLEAVRRAGVQLDPTQAELLRAELSQLEAAQGQPSGDPPAQHQPGDVQMSGPAPQETAAQVEHQRAVIASLQEELRLARASAGGHKTPAPPVLDEPAIKKAKQDPPDAGDSSMADGGSGSADGNRSRSPKNRSKPAGDDPGQKN